MQVQACAVEWWYEFACEEAWWLLQCAKVEKMQEVTKCMGNQFGDQRNQFQGRKFILGRPIHLIPMHEIGLTDLKSIWGKYVKGKSVYHIEILIWEWFKLI